MLWLGRGEIALRVAWGQSAVLGLDPVGRPRPALRVEVEHPAARPSPAQRPTSLPPTPVPCRLGLPLTGP